MKVTYSGQRDPIGQVPKRPCFCHKMECPYLDLDGICDDPKTGKMNGDSACHRESNRKLIERLEYVEL